MFKRFDVGVYCGMINWIIVFEIISNYGLNFRNIIVSVIIDVIIDCLLRKLSDKLLLS